MNFVYSKVARKLTEWENVETDSQWQNSLTFKLFLFQFINSYSSLIYIAFGRSTYGLCQDNDCLSELDEQLTTIFITNFLLNGVEIGSPIFMLKYRAWKERKAAKKNMLHSADLSIVAVALAAKSGNAKISNTELQQLKNEYESPLEDYMEIVIQYGYIVMFSASFPLAPLLCLLMGIIEVRVDAYKLTDLTRRPIPNQAHGIGNWMQILRFLSFAGIFTNATIIVFTSTMVKIDELEHKWFIWLIIVNALLILKVVIRYFVPEVPALHKQIIEWQEKTVNERINKKDLNRDHRRLTQGLFMQGPDVATAEFARGKISVVNRAS